MSKFSWLLPAVLLCLNGCVMNSTRELARGGVASENRAVIVYGVKVEGAWDFPAFNVQLAQYDVQAQKITGNCLTFNRTDARVPATPGAMKYFAFDVPPGHYVYSPFNGASLQGPALAFEARPWQSVYIGDFIYEKNKSVKLLRNLPDAMSAIDQALPSLDGHLSLASATPASTAYIFVCTP